ncbi:hypothetical protein ACFU8W_24620 [Streptomyces sp. NPDC057565]|uniref:hypothetical protein n=1 Tax=Streptomyces sp. NPDC057565 TaxID=3346169 RepID=UPI0036D09CD2
MPSLWQRARPELAWKIQPKRSGETAILRRGGYGLYKSGLGYINRDEAIIATRTPWMPWWSGSRDRGVDRTI